MGRDQLEGGQPRQEPAFSRLAACKAAAARIGRPTCVFDGAPELLQHQGANSIDDRTHIRRLPIVVIHQDGECQHLAVLPPRVSRKRTDMRKRAGLGEDAAFAGGVRETRVQRAILSGHRQQPYPGIAQWRTVHVRQQPHHGRGRHQVETRQSRSIGEGVTAAVDPTSPENACSSSRSGFATADIARARATARNAISACRFWLTLSVMRRSSTSGAEIAPRQLHARFRLGRRHRFAVRDAIAIQMYGPRVAANRNPVPQQRIAEGLAA